jgi:hypothetical protein
VKHLLSALVVVSMVLVTQFTWAAQIATCKGVATSKINAATASAKAQVCTHAAAIAANSERTSKNQLAADAKAIFTSLETQFNLPPFCAAAIVGVLIQGLNDGSVSAGSCAAP